MERPLFPPGFSDLEEVVMGAHQRIVHIDQLIENMPDDKGYQYNFDPPGGFSLRHPQTKAQRIAGLTAEKEGLQERTHQYVGARVAGLDKAVAWQVKDQAEKLVYPNKLDRLNKEELNAIKPAIKDMDQSQDWMRKSRADFKGTKQTAPVAEQQKAEPVPADKAGIDQEGWSMHHQFFQSLDYPDGVDQAIGEDRGLERGDRPELLKDDGPDLDRE